MAMFSKKQSKNDVTALPRTIRKKLSVYIAASICFAVLSAVLIYSSISINAKAKAETSETDDYAVAMENIDNLQKSLEEKRKLVQKNGSSIASPIMEESSFYTYVSSAADKFDLKVGYVRAGDSTNENGVASQYYELMFTGNGTNLKLLLESMDTLPSSFKIDSLSYRVKTNSTWVGRAIDSATTYNWFQSTDEVVDSTTVSGETLTLADMLDYDTCSLYMKIAFVTTN